MNRPRNVYVIEAHHFIEIFPAWHHFTKWNNVYIEMRLSASRNGVILYIKSNKWQKMSKWLINNGFILGIPGVNGARNGENNVERRHDRPAEKMAIEIREMHQSSGTSARPHRNEMKEAESIGVHTSAINVTRNHLYRKHIRHGLTSSSKMFIGWPHHHHQRNHHHHRKRT